MCMGKPTHVHKYGISQSVFELIHSDCTCPHDVRISNMKLEEIQHMEFDPSELIEYRSSPPPAYESAPPYTSTLTYTTIVDDKASLFTATPYYGEKGGLPLPVTMSTKEPEKLTRLSKLLLVSTMLMLLHIGYQTLRY